MLSEVISLLINVVLSGGLIVTLVTIRSTRKKAQTEEKQAEMDLSKTYVEEFNKNIVKPLNDKVEELSNETTGLKRELSRFRKAIEKSKNCPYVASCPVERELQKSPKDSGADSHPQRAEPKDDKR